MIAISIPYPQKRIGPYLLLILILSILFYRFARHHPSRADKLQKQDIEAYNLPQKNQGSLTLLTYNIAGLPQIISSARTPRAASIQSIGSKIQAYDIVNLQEDFNYNTELYRDNKHPFRTENKGRVPFGDGLSTLSKYPILSLQRIAWKDCSGTDCLTPKGFAHMRIALSPTATIDVYNIHATSAYNENARQARRKNLLQLGNYIQKHSQDQALVLMGDFNAYYAYIGDYMHEFKNSLNLFDAWVELNCAGQTPEATAQFQLPEMLHINDKKESLDKILYRPNAQIHFSPQMYRSEKNRFSSANQEDLSDHLPISLQLAWQINTQVTSL